MPDSQKAKFSVGLTRGERWEVLIAPGYSTDQYRQKREGFPSTATNTLIGDQETGMEFNQ